MGARNANLRFMIRIPRGSNRIQGAIGAILSVRFNGAQERVRSARRTHWASRDRASTTRPGGSAFALVPRRFQSGETDYDGESQTISIAKFSHAPESV
jgi:hypothetical protein